jgi:hypothetical protein
MFAPVGPRKSSMSEGASNESPFNTAKSWHSSTQLEGPVFTTTHRRMKAGEFMINAFLRETEPISIMFLRISRGYTADDRA